MGTIRNPIKNFYGQTIGYIEMDDKGNKTVRNFYNQILGYYMVDDNTTRNFYKQIIGKGDMCSMLLSNDYEAKRHGTSR